jgi:hypothetical protein
MTDHPFAITLDVATSRHNHTGSWRTERPEYVHRRAPCGAHCPAGEDPQAWLALAEEGDYEGAWRLIMEDNPLPAVMGRVCYHPCETACNRAQLDEAVGINGVERFLGDTAIQRGWTVAPLRPPTGRCVLVVGAGPSGLSAAYHLARLGHEVTIRDAGPLAGGSSMEGGEPPPLLGRRVVVYGRRRRPRSRPGGGRCARSWRWARRATCRCWTTSAGSRSPTAWSRSAPTS